MTKKNVLITGTRSGIGRAIAERLHEKGELVWGTSRREVQDTGFHTIFCDVTDETSVISTVDTFIEQNGHIDVLINNAGYGLAGPIEETSIEEAKQQLDTNLFGPIRMTQAVLPHMRRQKQGTIINIGSLGGMIGLPFQAHYSVSKSALESITEALRHEVRPWNIDVVNVNPGDIKTGFSDSLVEAAGITETYRKIYNQTVGRYRKDEKNGSNPVIVAKAVEKVLYSSRKPPVRVLVGKKDQTYTIRLKGLIGSRNFERIFSKIYKLG